MEKLCGHVPGHSDILSLKNRCLTMLPDLQPLEKLCGYMSSNPDVLSLENRCLATLPTVKSTALTSPLLQGLHISHTAQADLHSLKTSNCLLPELPTKKTPCFSEELDLPPGPRALKSMSATAQVQEVALVFAFGCSS